MTKTVELSNQDSYQLTVTKLINKIRKIQSLVNQCENFSETLETLCVDGVKLDAKYFLLKKEQERVQKSVDIFGTRLAMLSAIIDDPDYYSSSVPSTLDHDMDKTEVLLW